MEVVGAVAGVAQLASTVFKISKTLYEVGDAWSKAPNDIKDLARDLETFSDELRLLSSLLDDKTSRYSDQVHRLTAKIIGDCATICVKIDKILRKLRSGSVFARVKWLYKEKEIMKLLARLRDLKLSLMGMLGMLSALKADVMMNAMGLQTPSLLEGNGDEHVSKETMIQVEETRRILAGITIGSEEISKTEQTINKNSPADILYSATHRNEDAFKSNSDWGEQPEAPPFLSTLVLPGIASLGQNAKAMESVQSFHSAVSFQQDDESTLNNYFPEAPKTDSAISYVQSESQPPRYTSQPFYSQDADHESWRADLIASTMKRFYMSREAAESWVATLPSAAPSSQAIPQSSYGGADILGESPTMEEASDEEPGGWVEMDWNPPPRKRMRRERPQSNARAAPIVRNQSMRRSESGPFERRIMLDDPLNVKTPAQAQAQAQSQAQAQAQAQVQAQTQIQTQAAKAQAQAQIQQSALQQSQPTVSKYGSQHLLEGNPPGIQHTSEWNPQPSIQDEDFLSLNEDVSTWQGQDHLLIEPSYISGSPTTHHTQNSGNLDFDLSYDIGGQSPFLGSSAASFLRMASPKTTESIAPPPLAPPSTFNSTYPKPLALKKSFLPALNLQSKLPVPKPDWNSWNQNTSTTGTESDFDFDSFRSSPIANDTEAGQTVASESYVVYKGPKDIPHREEAPPPEYTFKVLNAIKRSRERTERESPRQPHQNLQRLEDLTTDVTTQSHSPSTGTRSSQLWWRTFTKLQHSEPEIAQTLEQIWGDQSGLMLRASLPPTTSVSLSDPVAASALCIALPAKLESLLTSTETQLSELRQQYTRIESIVSIMKSTLAFKTGTLAWLCVYKLLTGLNPSDTEEAPVLSQIADIVTLMARYNVMESMYQQWPNMSLDKNYEDSLVELCEYVLKYFVAVLKAFQISDVNNDEAEKDPQPGGSSSPGNASRNLSSEALTPFLKSIERADEKCRSFTVTIVSEEVSMREGSLKRKVEDNGDEGGEGEDSDDSDRTAVAEQEVEAGKGKERLETKEIGPLVTRARA